MVVDAVVVFHFTVRVRHSKGYRCLLAFFLHNIGADVDFGEGDVVLSFAAVDEDDSDAVTGCGVERGIHHTVDLVADAEEDQAAFAQIGGQHVFLVNRLETCTCAGGKKNTQQDEDDG